MSHTPDASRPLPHQLHPLLVCGHGTYQDGHFYAEYNERDLYLQHALEVGDVASKFGYNALVCTGANTKAQTPDISEAQSLGVLWRELSRVPLQADGSALPCVLEEAALDSAQNIVFGLMRLRLALRERGQGGLPFRRIGIWTVWQYKRNRYQHLADALGIGSQLYFHGLAPVERCANPARAAKSEQRQVEVLRETHDPLMLAASWGHKRDKRNANPDVRAAHLAVLVAAFPRCFAALDGEAWRVDARGTVEVFREAFQVEVIHDQQEGPHAGA